MPSPAIAHTGFMTDPTTWAERGDDWKDLEERLASVPDMFALLTTLRRRIQDAVDARQLGWRLYLNLEQSYFSFQRWKGRDHDNALGAEFRILQRSVELALSRRTSRRVQAADHFRQNARVRKGHWLIEVPGVHDVPDIERAVELVADDLGPSDSEPADFARCARSTALDGDASGARGIENQAAGALELLDTPAVGAHGPAGFRTAAAERHAIEDRAMEVVKKQFTDDGWDVEDVHRSCSAGDPASDAAWDLPGRVGSPCRNQQVGHRTPRERPPPAEYGDPAQSGAGVRRASGDQFRGAADSPPGVGVAGRTASSHHSGNMSRRWARRFENSESRM